MSASAYPHLGLLFGAYMHQEWGCEGKDWADLVNNFARSETAADLPAIAAEIDRLLIDYSDDNALHDQLYRVLGCYYDPRPDLGGPTVRTWLAQVAAFLRKNTQPAKRDAPSDFPFQA
jgi:hypothetical protein